MSVDSDVDIDGLISYLNKSFEGLQQINEYNGANYTKIINGLNYIKISSGKLK